MKNGVLEYWSIGVMEEPDNFWVMVKAGAEALLASAFSTPALQRSNTPF